MVQGAQILGRDHDAERFRKSGEEARDYARGSLRAVRGRPLVITWWTKLMPAAVGVGRPGRHARVNGMSMYYEESGRGRPLLLLHGGLGFAGEWEPFVPALSEHFRVIALDSRDHARSDNPRDELSYRIMTDDVAALVEVLELGSVSVIGNSDGAQIALELGARHAELVDCLVICAGGLRTSDGYLEAWQQMGVDRSGNVDFERFAMAVGEETLQLVRARHSSDDDVDRWQRLLARLAKMWMTPLAFTTVDFARIDGPVLLMLGDRDHLIPVEEGLELYRSLPNAELAVVPGSDHSIPFSEVELCSRIILSFLRRQS